MSTSLNIKKMQIKTTLIFHFIPVRIATIKNTNNRGSKMVTGTQQQTAWVLLIREIAETLETRLAKVKHDGELIVWHSEPLDRGRLLHTPYICPPNTRPIGLLCSTSPQLHMGLQNPCIARPPVPWEPSPSGPAKPRLHVGMQDVCPTRPTTPLALQGSSSVWDHQIPTLPVSQPFRPQQAPAL
jgi:hypothetical protein